MKIYPWLHKFKISKKFIALSISGLLTLGIAQRKAYAQVSDFFDNFETGLDSIISILEVFEDSLGIERWLALLDGSLDDPCSNVPVIFIASPEPGWCNANGSSTTDILADSTGELGIPNPNQARQEVEERVDTTGETDFFEVNPEVHSLYLANSLDRVATKIAIDTVLGEEGQQQIQTELEITNSTLAAIASEAEAAQELDVTQDVMKATIRVMANQSALMGASHTDATNARIDRQFGNLNLVNISRTLDEGQKAKRVESAAAGAKALYMGAQVGLF
ncbi:MAG: hypothetical protein AB4368_00275 [Xenococcaceae cyanobacterium]